MAFVQVGESAGNLGGQAVTTTGTITGGTITATTAFTSSAGYIGIGSLGSGSAGSYRGANATTLLAAATANGLDYIGLISTNASNEMYVGMSSAGTKMPSLVYIDNVSGCTIRVNNVAKLAVSSASVAFTTTNIGFFSATPAAKQTVTGSRGANAALASLLTALATLGLITDSTS